jgi:aspartate 1-decarboxylase
MMTTSTPQASGITRTMLFSKIHRATVTCADLGYEGSLSIDEALLELSGILPYQHIAVYNINNGQRFETYAIKAPRHSGVIQVNGAAARLAEKGDLLIIASFAQVPEEQCPNWQPHKVFVDAQNQPKTPVAV